MIQPATSGLWANRSPSPPLHSVSLLQFSGIQPSNLSRHVALVSISFTTFCYQIRCQPPPNRKRSHLSVPGCTASARRIEWMPGRWGQETAFGPEGCHLTAQRSTYVFHQQDEVKLVSGAWLELGDEVNIEVAGFGGFGMYE